MQWQNELYKNIGVRDNIKSNIDKLDNNIQKIKNDNKDIEEAINVLSKMVESVIASKKGFIEGVINKGLKYIFDNDNFQFSIKHTIKNNKNIWYYELSNNDIVGDINNFGGGVMAVISLLLRVAIVIITNRARIMILDESLNHVSIQYQEKVSEFIKVLSQEFEMDIMLVTHQEMLSKSSDYNIHLDKINNKLEIVS